MDKLTIYKILIQEEFPKYTVIKIPQYKNIPKYTKFKNFLHNNIEEIRSWLVCDNEDIGALEINSKEIQINLEKCIGCMACLSSVKNLDGLTTSKDELIKRIYPNIPKLFNEKKIFNGNVLQFPYFINSKTKSFPQFTSVKETKHLSLWACIILNFLSSSDSSRIGKEIEIMKMDSPRDGRLDVCVESNELILICESKVDLDSLLNENRYRIQIPIYKKECQRLIDDYNQKYSEGKKISIFLLIGGQESDLLPEFHPDCSSRAGNKSKRFYDDIIKHNIKFVSANFLLLLVIYSLYFNKRICFDLMINELGDSFIGLTTAGIIKMQGDKVSVVPIKYEFINSFEKPFS